ncbi:caspase family protein, partial [Klebsiella aerogenes]|uniref:caspase family protein n=1 Tax=Klebsiella aerogenes TaxID=548 RepID=UPI0013CF7FB2
STAANGAGLVAQTLQAAGFDVVGARDLDAAALRSAFRDFLDKAWMSGPDTVAFVYFAGHAVQFDGENYL